jgi:rhodanese-related sulfurtransferase
MQTHPKQVVIVDARSERTYNESDQAIPGAVRLPPDQPVRTAAQLSVPKAAVLAVLCA